MDLNKGAEERGCAFRVKKARIYVHLQLQKNTGSTRVVNTRPCIFQISARQKIFWEIFGMVAQCMDDKRTTRLTCRCRWTWRCRPLMIHVRVCAQRSSTTKTQGNLVCPAFSKSPTDEGLGGNPANRSTGHPSPVPSKQGIFLFFSIFFWREIIFLKKNVSLSVSFTLVVHALWVFCGLMYSTNVRW